MTPSERIIGMLLRRNRVLVAGLVLVLIFLAAGLPFLRVSSDNRAFFGTENQEYADLRRIADTYTLSNTLLLMLVPPEGAAFAPDTLERLRRMTEDAWQTPYALRVDSPVNYMHSYARGEDIVVEPMLEETGAITPAAAERFRELAMASEALVGALISADGDAFGITIRVVLPEGRPDARLEVETFLTDLKARWRAENPGWEIRASGGVLGSNLLARVAIQDILYLVPLALAAVVTLLILAMGSVVSVAASVCVLVSATIATYGFAGWTGVVLTAGTAISPLAVMVLVSTSCVHINLGWIRAAETSDSPQPFLRALTRNLAPVTVSHLTTAVGFLGLNFAPSPPLREMGNIVAFGLVFGQFAVFILLPFLLSGRPVPSGRRLMVSARTMRALARWVVARRALWLTLFPVMVAGALFGLSRIDYDDNVIRYFDYRYELRQDSEAIEARLTGLEALQFSFRAPEGASVFDPDFLRAVDRFASWLEGRPAIVSVASLTSILKSLNQSMNGDDPAAAVVADTQQGNAQLMMFYELSLPVGMDLNAMMDVDRTQTLVTATVRGEHARVIRGLAAEAERWLADNEPALAARASGLAIAFARISERNNSQMLYGFLAVLGLVSATMVATLRSARFGAISLVPNLLPALLAFGTWGIVMGDVNLGSTVVTTMTFGIVVDDTVHFLMHYLRGRRRALPPLAAMEDTFAVVGSSIVLTSISLIVGFSVMAASGFAINQHIGLLTAVVIFYALVSDLLLLPALLAVVERGRE